MLSILVLKNVISIIERPLESVIVMVLSAELSSKAPVSEFSLFWIWLISSVHLCLCYRTGTLIFVQCDLLLQSLVPCVLKQNYYVRFIWSFVSCYNTKTLCYQRSVHSSLCYRTGMLDLVSCTLLLQSLVPCVPLQSCNVRLDPLCLVVIKLKC